jgi:hypothetical protein
VDVAGGGDVEDELVRVEQGDAASPHAAPQYFAICSFFFSIASPLDLVGVQLLPDLARPNALTLSIMSLMTSEYRCPSLALTHSRRTLSSSTPKSFSIFWSSGKRRMVL